MKSSIFAAVSALILFTCDVTAQTTTTVALKAIQTLSCSKTNGTLQKMQEYDFASDGWCQRLCGYANYPVMAMTQGSTCYCGNQIPALDQAVSESYCNSPCMGYNTSTCGGIGYYQIYLSGLTTDVTIQPNGTSSSSSSSSSTTATTSKAQTTVVVTKSASPSDTDTDSSGSNKVGVAVGVVVGLVALSGLMGAIIFYMRQRQKRAIEAEHHRLEAQAAALAAEKSDAASSRTDQRLDPSVFSHRRESIGSIADEMDFSRRILQVRHAAVEVKHA